MKNRNVQEKMMETETVFVENGIEYYEENGLYYPKLIMGNELEADVYVGRWGREWMRYLESVDKIRYRRLLISGGLKKIAKVVDGEARNMVQRLEQEYCCSAY